MIPRFYDSLMLPGLRPSFLFDFSTYLIVSCNLVGLTSNGVLANEAMGNLPLNG